MTIFGSQLSRGLGEFAAAAEQVEVPVDARTRILAEVNWQADRGAPVLIIVHGLGGDARRSYVLGTADKAWRSGFSVVRMNMRNSAGTEAWTPTLYNAGTGCPQMSSCFLLSMQGDSIEGIFETLKQCALISKSAGGIGVAEWIAS